MSAVTRELETLSTLHREFLAKQSEINNHRDEYLTPEGLQVERTKRTEKLREETRTALDRVKSGVDVERTHLVSRMDKAMPKSAGSTADAWARAKMLLDSGRSLNQVIKYADADILAAVREWAPTWLETQRSPETLGEGISGGRAPLDLTAFNNTVALRWAALNGNDSSIMEHMESLPDLAQFDSLASSMERRLLGHPINAMEEAAGAHYAAQFARVTLDTEA